MSCFLCYSELWQILIIPHTTFNVALWVTTYNRHHDIILCIITKKTLNFVCIIHI